jgi:hypothetical protein
MTKTLQEAIERLQQCPRIGKTSLPTSCGMPSKKANDKSRLVKRYHTMRPNGDLRNGSRLRPEGPRYDSPGWSSGIDSLALKGRAYVSISMSAPLQGFVHFNEQTQGSALGYHGAAF